MTDVAVNTDPAGRVATVDDDVQRLGSRPIVLALLTYNNAATVPGIAQTGYRGLSRAFPDVPLAIVNADSGSSDGTTERLVALGLPVTLGRHESPLHELTAVPFHGVPGRTLALSLALQTTGRRGARAIVLLEADVTSVTEDWLDRLARPVWEDNADLVLPAYARHRYDGTITNLLLAPLVRALYGRRLRQPLAGALAISGRLVEHLLLLHPGWRWAGRDLADLWIIGTAIADGLALWAARLWARAVYDFPLGHHYSVVHRDHLLRSLVPLYLGRTAAFVATTRRADAAATDAALEAVGAAFERQKRYLVERW